MQSVKILRNFTERSAMYHIYAKNAFFKFNFKKEENKNNQKELSQVEESTEKDLKKINKTPVKVIKESKINEYFRSEIKKILFLVGVGLIGVGTAGKGFLNLIRVLKSKKLNIKTGRIGLYYKGGFDSQMTRREAYLILGVRESATASEIKDRHKKMMLLNHPDSGGSTFLASKINSAKELVIMDAPDFKI